MSDGWSKLRDIDPLADGQAAFDFTIPLNVFPRVAPQLANAEGSVHGSARFARQLGVAVADVAVSAVLPLVCQRCLGALEWTLEGGSRVALVGEGEEADRVPEGLETVLAAEHRITLRDLVEEELLVSLPIVPLHATLSECEAAQPSDAAVIQDAAPAADEHAENVQRPFERLGELLKRRE